MSTQSIMRELEQLRKTLDRCPCVSSKQLVAPKTSSCGCQCSCSSSSTTRRHHDAAPVDRLAASAARLEEILHKSNRRFDADTRIVADTYKRSHQHKESEVAAKDRVIDNLHETLRSTKNDTQEKLAEQESSLSQALATLASTQKQLASAQGETEALGGSLARMTSRLHNTEAELLQALQGKQAAQAAQASALRDLDAAHGECRHVKSALEAAEARALQLGKEVEESKAAAATQRLELRTHVAQATQDLEQCLESLRQQVAAERTARTAAEECYQAELRSHQQTEALVLQLRQLLLQDEEPSKGCGCAAHGHPPTGCGCASTTETREPATEATLRRLASDNRHVRENVQAIKSMIHQELTTRTNPSSSREKQGKQPVVQVYY